MWNNAWQYIQSQNSHMLFIFLSIDTFAPTLMHMHSHSLRPCSKKLIFPTYILLQFVGSIQGMKHFFSSFCSHQPMAGLIFY